MASSPYPYDVNLLRDDTGTTGPAQSFPSDVHAGSSSLYTYNYAPVPPGSPGGPGYPAPIPYQQGDPRPQSMRDDNRGPPSTIAFQKPEEYPHDAREDGVAPPPPPSPTKSRRRRMLLFGLLIFLVVLGATLGGALGATLGKHSSNDSATTTKTTSSVRSGGPTSSAPTTTTFVSGASTVTTTTTSSAPLVTANLHYVIKNNLESLVMDYNVGNGSVAGWESNNGLNQQWLFESAGDGSWYIRSAYNPVYITWAGNAAQQPDYLVAVPTRVQSWVIESNSSSPGTSTIRHPDASLSLYIDIPIASSNDGNPIQLWKNPPSGRQNWVLTVV